MGVSSVSSSPIELKPPSGNGINFNFDDDLQEANFSSNENKYQQASAPSQQYNNYANDNGNS